ncbi:hypothetical protein C5B42_04255 [Candidatus Cerribacteria bacterium 'Amazon FNV 2010 28 9']|uniref:Uncharacterized protein n=1 Tax=Candidatus Cerribacteria bacterium 'Amazon FNV 2010 28 9' TaxID=2081795 RepID=A0A317JPD6_9BACT|nr:MAG: hypothetical protein C5B42_04255 [Candidatus Cerribacteria bacterium 'Amazon FNV 2010 28 9']
MGNDDQSSPQQGLFSLSDLIKKRANADINKYVSREFQDYGYRLAMELDDEAHKSLYIKMAKTVDRKILEQARTFVIDANALSKARLFMWKVKELRGKVKTK